MLVYKDRTFCESSKDCCATCERRLTQQDARQAAALNLDMSYANLRDSEHCPGFEPLHTESLQYYGT